MCSYTHFRVFCASGEKPALRACQVARTPESVFALAPRIVREEGLRALYRGLPTELCKARLLRS